MRNKSKILVLSDINKTTNTILKNGLNLAKIVDGEVDFLCVKKPTELVEKESQLSAMRTINKEFIKTDNSIKKIIQEVSTDENIAIRHKISFGNLKDEISQHIKKTEPDIVVLGKGKSKILPFMGDKIIDFVLKEYAGTVMIASNKNPLEANSELALGMFNNSDSIQNKFEESLVSYSKKPLKSFQINGENSSKKEVLSSKKTIDFVFESGDNAIKNMSNYLSKNNIDLLFVKREKNKASSLVNDLNCSLMLSN